MPLLARPSALPRLSTCGGLAAVNSTTTPVENQDRTSQIVSGLRVEAAQTSSSPTVSRDPGAAPARRQGEERRCTTPGTDSCAAADTSAEEDGTLLADGRCYFCARLDARGRVEVG